MNRMHFVLVGCNHRTTPLAFRERLAFPVEAQPAALRELFGLSSVQECVLLSTCNRVEVWAVSQKPHHATRDIREFFSKQRRIEMGELEPCLCEHIDTAAIRHIFEVTSSLDAMVVGESQICGQVKEAYSRAARGRTVGPLLGRCLHRAFSTAKRIRTETDIARHPVSVSSVAADLAKRVFGDLSESSVLVLGAGEMAELVVRHLLADGAKTIHVLNRTPERATQLAAQLGAQAFPFETLNDELKLVDILIGSTGSSEPLLHRKRMADVMRERKQRPLFIVDIAVPRDVERSVGDLPNVYLFNVDDLQEVAQANLKGRKKEVVHAERILDEEVRHFCDWLRTQDAVPLIKQLRVHFETVVENEASQVARTLGLDGEKKHEFLTAMSQAVVNKLLHDPCTELKKNADQPEGILLSRATRQLFHLMGSEEKGGDAPPIEEDE